MTPGTSASGTRPHVLAVGAYERDNFGDMLYLELMRAHIGDRLELEFAAPIASDKAEVVGQTIPAAAPILARGGIDAVWTVGGEVVSASLEYAYRTAFGDEALRKLMALPRESRVNELRKATGGIIYDSPYIVRPSAMQEPRTALILNSIGAAGVEQMDGARKATIQATLREASFLSVRDAGSDRALAALGIAHRLAPDLAHTVSRVHPATNEEVGPPYALVQLPEFAVREHGLDAWVAGLASSGALAKYSIRFFLAGLAPGHDTLETAVRARDALAGATGWTVQISEARGVWPRVNEIAGAALWLGGSLHGRIVASSYSVPRVSIASWKVSQYAETWDANYPYGVTPGSLAHAIEKASRTVDHADPMVLASQAQSSLEAATEVALDWRSSLGRTQQLDRLLRHRVDEADQLRLLLSQHEDGAGSSRAAADPLREELIRLREDRDRWKAEATTLRTDRDSWKVQAEQAGEERQDLKDELERVRADRDRWAVQATDLRADRDRWAAQATDLRADRDSQREHNERWRRSGGVVSDTGLSDRSPE